MNLGGGMLRGMREMGGLGIYDHVSLYMFIKQQEREERQIAQ